MKIQILKAKLADSILGKADNINYRVIWLMNEFAAFLFYIKFVSVLENAQSGFSKRNLFFAIHS